LIFNNKNSNIFSFIAVRSMAECMTQCSSFYDQCQSGIFESQTKTCRLLNEPLSQLKEENPEKRVYFMKISSVTGK